MDFLNSFIVRKQKHILLKMSLINKKKIINDPVYGFINIPSDFIFDVIEHSYFQRLRRIKQLGLTYYVYPGAVHSRFQHVIGAMYLMKTAIDVLKTKGVEISVDEEEATILAILLHDMGHGPFSHTLEYSFVNNISHEEISVLFMKELNKIYSGKLTLALEIFQNKYSKKFLHQLVSSQLDMDRLDYLQRDSFFTGVTEGIIGFERIIKMLNVSNNEIVVDAKGIYSVENFLIARRLMYWQVYLHKTVVVTEQILTKIIIRAKELYKSGNKLFTTPALDFFFKNEINTIEKFEHIGALNYFALLDDYDVMTSIKIWMNHEDFVLSFLCKSLINRNLFKIEINKDENFDNSKIEELKKNIATRFSIPNSETNYLVFTGKIYNKAYSRNRDELINILYNKGTLIDIAKASDISNVSVLSKSVVKYFLCYTK